MHRRAFLGALGGFIALACAPRSVLVSSPTPATLAIPARDVWPPLYRQAAANTKEAYSFAMAHPELLRFVPCFCGCGRQGHQDNYDCFVRDETAPGSYELDPHGLNCGVCVGVALDSKALLAQGLSRPAIRAAIDRKWSSTGPATPTPLPLD